MSLIGQSSPPGRIIGFWYWIIGACVLASAPIASPAERAFAVEEFQKLQQDLVADKKRSDWNAFLADAKRLKSFLNGSPTSGLEVARAQLELGRPEAALPEIQRFLAMGQTNPILDSPAFRGFRAAIDPQVQSNLASRSLARATIHLSNARVLPEDIDYDPASKRFFVTSILEHNIIALDSDGDERVFADSPDHWPMVALKVDAQRRRLWATEVALDQFTSVQEADWGRSVLLEYDLDRGTLLFRHNGPPHSNLGDMVLADNGDPVVSDGTGGGVYRLRGSQLRRIDHGDFISPQTIAICRDSRQAFVPDYVRGVAAFNLKTGAVRWLSMKDRYALNGIDGLYCHGNSLVAVQNGTSPERVVVFALDSPRSTIVAETIIERATSTLGDPTHGVFIEGTFYYIANSGWNAVDEHGAEIVAPRLTPALIMSADAASITATSRGATKVLRPLMDPPMR
jgi:sugar lactone lactonase YvrE